MKFMPSLTAFLSAPRSLLGALCLLSLLGLAQAQDKSMNLKMSSWVPAQHPLNPALQAWSDSIKKESGGTLNFTLFPS
jgi:TRAP-type C4-dicarboxylate transport system substrate-binding protein